MEHNIKIGDTLILKAKDGENHTRLTYVGNNEATSETWLRYIGRPGEWQQTSGVKRPMNDAIITRWTELKAEEK